MQAKGYNKYKGNKGENIVARYLDGKGLSVLNTNYRSAYGEIDIIARDIDSIVFIEVKHRNTLKYGLPREAVTKSKQRKIINTALSYIAENSLDKYDFRFDVIELYGQDSMRLEHIVNAF